MSRQESGNKILPLDKMTASDLIKMRFSKLEERDTRQRVRELEHLEELIKAAEIASVQAEQQRDLNRIMNARVAINRFPVEVLQNIFVMSCTFTLPGRKYSYYRCNDIITVWNPTWIHMARAVRLMCVCHHWNKIALGTRGLWNCIEPVQGNGDHVLLERSIRGPLKVLVSQLKLEPHYAVAHALQNVEYSSRIQELYWILPSEHENGEYLRKYFRMPAPFLRSLALHGDWNPMPDGSLKLFDNHIPCLERLSLSDVNWLPSNAFTKLTFLALNYCNVPKAPIKLRGLLAGTPNLVDLILRNIADISLPRVRLEIDAADMKLVSLPRLRRLLIKDMWADDIEYVFRDAQLNEDVSVSIKHMNKRDDGRQMLESVFTWSLNALKQPKGLHFRQDLVIVAGASSGLRFEVERGMTLEDWITFNGLQMLSLSSISHLCTFERDTCRVPGLERVRNLLRQMTALETLSVNIESLTKIVDALALFRDPTDPPLCPALTTLRIAIRYESDCDIILDSVLPHRAQLGVKHLYVGLINFSSTHWRPRQAVKDQLDGNFESVNFEALWNDKAYNISLPLVCKENVYALWPPWL
ncbi:uncharacterized protein LAESUDRAFT_730969 [Laetiporus sulphureus 93-53]|uniref:F-box domain-containing protein n=1 Tax=Laetiporus sulphureus 93-53 TaxID=1314785 RepID=A0A165BUS0_9APHY|nr:uncharacterized protein LAESUDRAFT_730969 [Laetiporus sulphureus 93-53]KZT01693.1 hypothetical protein LAESUDRAFT_730969 [Laetiporus sulphureus 93-53]